MVSAFGGSTSSLERRRRLMTLEERAVSDEILRDFGIVVPEASSEPTPTGPVGERFLPRLISRHLWKHWAFLIPIGLLLIGLSRGLVMSSSDLSGPSSGSGPSSQMLVGRIADGCAGILFLLTAQLCLVIGWMRSQSSVDFRGHYRAWRWASAICGIAAILSLTGTLSSLPDLVAASVEPMTGRLAASRLTLVLVPAVLLLVPILFRLIPDLGRCRTSQAFMVLGLGALVSGVGIHVNRTAAIHPAAIQILFLSGSFFVFAASLLHARFVMYISHDPPARRIRKPTTAARSAESDAQQSDGHKQPLAESSPAAAVTANLKDGESAKATEDVPTQAKPESPAVAAPEKTDPPVELDPPTATDSSVSKSENYSKHDKKKQKQKALRKAG